MEASKTGLLVSQTITTLGGAKKSPDGALLDAGTWREVELVAIVNALSGSPTAVTLTMQESDTNTSAGQSDVAGAVLTFTGSEVAAGRAKAMTTRWRGRKRYAGIKVAVTGGTNASVTLVARALGPVDTAEATAPGTAVASATLI